ncbi:hypothetical protein LIER_01134 [Lithospermum erythrorhizon]|uniref:Uncharacterized protein n=1 Tax=Lithospermum erythrorhizon TaxID=34254 RepID=A0AAV3NKW4_LITER
MVVKWGMMWHILEGLLVARGPTCFYIHIYLSWFGRRARPFRGHPRALGCSFSRWLLASFLCDRWSQLCDYEEDDNVQVSTVQNPQLSEPETEDAKAFASSILSDPNANIIRCSKTTKKRKDEGAEAAWKTLKKSKARLEDKGVEGEDEELIVKPGVRDSQTLEGFRRKTTRSVILKGHLSHLCNHYNIHKDILMRIPLTGETHDLLEDGYTPMFLEFFNYRLRLQASTFVNSVLSSIDRAPGQLGPFAWVTLMAFQVGWLSGLATMLYSEKPGKTNPNRWHRIHCSEPRRLRSSSPRKWILTYSWNSPWRIIGSTPRGLLGYPLTGVLQQLEVLTSMPLLVLVPGIVAHFKKYVTNLGDEFVTELFDNLPDEDEEDKGCEYFFDSDQEQD